MNLHDYQKGVEDTWIKNEFEIERILCGLFGEIGEIAEKFKKYFRKDYGFYDLKKLVRKEIGDAFYYLAKLCNYFGFNAEEILKENNVKLISRKERGTLQGSGDDR